MAGNHMLQQEINQDLRLGLFHALNPGDELAVEEKRLLARDGVDADERVYGVDRVFADETAGLTDVGDHL